LRLPLLPGPCSATALRRCTPTCSTTRCHCGLFAANSTYRSISLRPANLSFLYGTGSVPNESCSFFGGGGKDSHLSVGRFLAGSEQISAWEFARLKSPVDAKILPYCVFIENQTDHGLSGLVARYDFETPRGNRAHMTLFLLNQNSNRPEQNFAAGDVSLIAPIPNFASSIQGVGGPQRW
jgi:hypothetical protein